MQWFFDRIGESSTWTGLALLAQAAGVFTGYTEVGSAAAALIGAVKVGKADKPGRR